MARGIHRLTALQVAKAMRRGLTLNDGGNLYLQRGRSWVFRYARHGKTHWLGLGPIDLVDLQAARAAALANRKLLFEGVDPMARRHAERARVAMTFAAAAWAYIAAHCDVGPGGGREGHRHPGALGMALRHRIDAFEQQLAVGQRGRAGGLQVDQVDRAEAEPVGLAVSGVAEKPTSGRVADTDYRRRSGSVPGASPSRPATPSIDGCRAPFHTPAHT